MSSIVDESGFNQAYQLNIAQRARLQRRASALVSKIRLSAEYGRNLDVHLVTFAGVIFFFFALGLGIQTLYLKLAGRAFTDFATVILLELIIGSLLMVSLGIIGEYLARIYEGAKGRPRYVVTEPIDPEQ